MAAMPDAAPPASTNLTTLRAVQGERQDLANIRMGFDSAAGFELLLRASKGFAQSDLVPAIYKGNVGSCTIALEMAARMGASPLMVMQNLYIVHGSPSWSSKFLIACFNQCGRFSALRYEFDGPKGAPTGCRAWAVEKSTGERLTGSTVTLAMAKEEGWSTKAGSKWKTMPEQMLMYRAAAFMIRSYAPEISMGLQTAEEAYDVVDQQPDGSYRVTTETMRADTPPPTPIVGEEVSPPAATAATDDQPGKPAGDAPTFTFAEVESKLLKAATIDELNDAATLITSVANRGHQKELVGTFEKRQTELGGD